MPSYAYTVLNKNGEKLTGTIDASDMGIARENLNELGFSVVAIDTNEEKKESDPRVTVFEFQGIDESGKKVEGTIKSNDELKAYSKLHKEYHFEVQYLVDSSLKNEEKEKAKNKGTTDLEVRLRKIEGKSEQAGNLIQQDQQNQEKELKNKIDFIIERVDKFMKLNAPILDPQKLSNIEQTRDKLLRIKSSKNIEYIKHTAADLLELLQGEELFMKGKISDDKRAHLKIEAKKIMEQLNIKNTKSLNIHELVQKMHDWRIYRFEDRDDLKWHEKILKAIIDWLETLFKEDIKVTILKEKLSTANHQIFAYIKLYLTEKTKEGKTDIKHSLNALFEERKKIKAELSGLKEKLHEISQAEKYKKNTGIKVNTGFMELIESFSGWLLFFYLIYYFAATYVTSKNFGLAYIPEGFYIDDSIAFKYIIVAIFLLHSSLSIKQKFYKNSILAGLIIFTISIVAGILILFNL